LQQYESNYFSELHFYMLNMLFDGGGAWRNISFMKTGPTTTQEFTPGHAVIAIREKEPMRVARIGMENGTDRSQTATWLSDSLPKQAVRALLAAGFVPHSSLMVGQIS
jgi:hypothetical protein